MQAHHTRQHLWEDGGRGVGQVELWVWGTRYWGVYVSRLSM